MICLCIGKPAVDRCKELLPDVELAEIRLDGSALSLDEIGQIFSLPSKLIATCRPNPGIRGEAERKNLLLSAIEAGAAYVDIEIEAEVDFKKEIMRAARLKGCRVILSYHNYENTPPKSKLEAVIARCFSEGADIAKIACQVHSQPDNARILSLYDIKINKKSNNQQIIAIGMGEKGKVTRVAAPLLGAPFTYAAPSPRSETGPGQLDKETLARIYELLSGSVGSRQ